MYVGTGIFGLSKSINENNLRTFSCNFEDNYFIYNKLVFLFFYFFLLCEPPILLLLII